MSRYAFIAACAEPWPVQLLCQVLAVSPAGYYQWRHRPPRRRRGKWRRKRPLRATPDATAPGGCGPKAMPWAATRCAPDCAGTGCGPCRPHRPRTTVADPAAVVAENRLLGQPAPTAPNQVWVGDITYLPLVGGRWCYLATWRDACSRRVVGWHLAAYMPTELVLHALEQALTLRLPAPALIIHADHGSQYTSAACRARIAQAGALPSFSRPGNPYDNAQAEAGWSTLKTELLPPGTAFASLEEARLEVAHYLDTYFNLDRRHSALGYRSPHQFEHDLKNNLSQLTVRFYWTTPPGATVS